MKTLIVVLVIFSLVALASSRPHKRRHGPKPCKVVFNNGTEVNNECQSWGGLFACEELDLSRFDNKQTR